MNNVAARLLSEFADDQRAVSAVIGFILIFGLLMLTLSVYQAQIVPQENAQTEFGHHEATQNQLIELRNSILESGQSNVSQFSDVKLGADYRTRTFTINPAPPAGSLETSEPYNITVSNGNPEDDVNVTTRFLTYEPDYNEQRIGPTRYEHSVLYLDERERGNGISASEDQTIVKNGSVRLTALQNEFQETGTERVSLELYPQQGLSEKRLPDPGDGNLTITVPTRLNETHYWDDALYDYAGGIYQGVDGDEDEYDDDTIYYLNLSVDDDDLRMNTVGATAEPDQNPPESPDNDDEIRVFDDTGSHTWDVPDGVDEVEVLVVGGGGSGGSVRTADFSDDYGGGGGGAGGVVYRPNYSVTSDEIDVVVGDGGVAPDGDGQGTSGGYSEFDSLVAIGGGGGGGDLYARDEGEDGGSGGGSVDARIYSTTSGGDGEQPANQSGGFGTDGGDGVGGTGDKGAGGGGGSGEEGAENDDLNGGDGGNGTYFGDRFGTDIGVDGWVAAGGGGGGGTGDSTPGSGGQGGGGDGTVDGGDPAGDGETNSGSGGGGGGSDGEPSSGDGGSGVVVVRWSE